MIHIVFKKLSYLNSLFMFARLFGETGWFVASFAKMIPWAGVSAFIRFNIYLYLTFYMSCFNTCYLKSQSPPQVAHTHHLTNSTYERMSITYVSFRYTDTYSFN